MQNGPTETSVLVSLRELVALEDERLKEEQEARDAAERAAEEARRRAVEQARAAEQARRRAEEEQRLARARAQAEEEARLAAIAEAEVERARIEAQAEAAQAARQSELEHQRVLARHEGERQKARLKMWGVGVMLAAIIGAGTIGTMALTPEETATDPTVERLKADRDKLLSDRLAALDGLRTRLQDRLDELEGSTSETDAAQQAVAAARGAVDTGSLTDAAIERYHQALERLATAIGQAHRAARLDRLHLLHDELDARVGGLHRPSSALKMAREHAEARRRAVAAGEPAGRELDAYDAALDRLALALGDEPRPGVARPAGPRPPTGDADVTEPVCDFHDPLCARLPE